MSLVLDIATYIATNSALVLNTSIFIGEEPSNVANTYALVMPSPGGFDNESGVEFRPIQILCYALSFIDAEILAYTIYNLLKNKPGFDTVSSVFYCEVLGSPYPADRDTRGRFVFSLNFMIKKITT